MIEQDRLSRLGAALSISLLGQVGLERDWQTRGEEIHQRAAGFRTFALSGLLRGVSGAVALLVGSVVLGFVFLGYAAAFTAFQTLEAWTSGTSLSGRS